MLCRVVEMRGCQRDDSRSGERHFGGLKTFELCLVYDFRALMNWVEVCGLRLAVFDAMG